MSNAIGSAGEWTITSRPGKRCARRPLEIGVCLYRTTANSRELVWGESDDRFGRTGQVQVLRVDLLYVDGTKGKMTIESPYTIWFDDIEAQWAYLRGYIETRQKVLGIADYEAHAGYLTATGEFKIVWSWA